ncbi:calcyphosin-like protein [Symsagittifera roscoffensis]|uniref:calcyphosin-like protein n=1 Tax=Symsagittifera roscoffensis TaxID=84072 RepID=UPI00307C9BEF
MASAADEDLNNELKKQAAARMQRAQDPLERMRLAILARGGQTGIKRFARAFRIMDDDRSRSLSKSEFFKGLRDFGVTLNEGEAENLFRMFDRDGSGSIIFDELIAHIRPPMSEARKRLVHEAFNKLDTSKDNVVTPDDLEGIYNFNQNPKFKSGEWTKKRCFYEWLKKFDDGQTKDFGSIEITFDEFLNYYSGISASIDSDAYFDLMMRNSWKL